MEGLLAQRYQLETVVGSGGMGTVWRAHDMLLDRQVAIKEVRYSAQLTDAEREGQATKAVAEARHAARLEHPHIVPIYDVLIHGGRPWIVMRFIAGTTLQEQVLAHGRLAPAEVQRIARGLLEALAAAHRGGVLHRDVKPSNVLITEDGEPMLTDFSIARAIGQGTVTNTGVVVGSPGYIAPERIIMGTAGPEADLFGLGATLFFATEGAAPFAHEDAMAGVFAAAIQPHPRPEHAGPELTLLLDGLLEKDPRARLTIAAAAEMLGVPAPTSAPAPTPTPATSPTKAGAVVTPPTPAISPPRRDAMEGPGAPAVWRAEISMPEPFTADQSEGPAVAKRWDGVRLALVAAIVVLLGGGVAVISQVTNWSAKDHGQPTNSANPQPSVTSSTASPTPSPAPQGLPESIKLITDRGFRSFAQTWLPYVGNCGESGVSVYCELNGPLKGKLLRLYRYGNGLSRSDMMQCQRDTGTPTAVDPKLVKLPGAKGYYCEFGHRYSPVPGENRTAASVGIAWAHPNEPLVGAIERQLVYNIPLDDPSYVIPDAAIEEIRTAWHTYSGL